VALAPGPYEVAFPSMAHGGAELAHARGRLGSRHGCLLRLIPGAGYPVADPARCRTLPGSASTVCSWWEARSTSPTIRRIRLVFDGQGVAVTGSRRGSAPVVMGRRGDGLRRPRRRGPDGREVTPVDVVSTSGTVRLLVGADRSGSVQFAALEQWLAAHEVSRRHQADRYRRLRSGHGDPTFIRRSGAPVPAAPPPAAPPPARHHHRATTGAPPPPVPPPPPRPCRRPGGTTRSGTPWSGPTAGPRNRLPDAGPPEHPVIPGSMRRAASGGGHVGGRLVLIVVEWAGGRAQSSPGPARPPHRLPRALSPRPADGQGAHVDPERPSLAGGRHRGDQAGSSPKLRSGRPGSPGPSPRAWTSPTARPAWCWRSGRRPDGQASSRSSSPRSASQPGFFTELQTAATIVRTHATSRATSRSSPGPLPRVCGSGRGLRAAVERTKRPGRTAGPAPLGCAGALPLHRRAGLRSLVTFSISDQANSCRSRWNWWRWQ